MCVVVVMLNLVAFLHSGLVTIRDTEAIIRPSTATKDSARSASKFMSCFTPPVSREHSFDMEASCSNSAETGSKLSARGAQQARSNSSKLFASTSLGDLSKLGRDRCVLARAALGLLDFSAKC